MGEHTEISWTNSTWNPNTGCTKVSAGCKNCYMYRDMTRYGKDPTVVKRTAPGTFNGPIIRKRDGAFKLPGPLIFTASWTDIFHIDIDADRPEIWEIIRKRGEIERAEGLPTSYFQVLTKRADRIADHLPPDWGPEGWPNVWLGVTVDDQDGTKRAEALAKIPAVVRFLSYEPACGPVKWRPVLASGRIDWLISGGESGGKEARPAHPDWFRAARDACGEFGVAYHHKQNGEWAPRAAKDEGRWINETGAHADYAHPATPEWTAVAMGGDRLAPIARVGREAAGRLLDGVTHDAFPVPRVIG